MRREEFLKICAEEEEAPHERSGIGTYSEKRLHIVLKKYSDPDITHHEFPLFGSVADIFDGEMITEIQTGSLRPLRKKIEKYLSDSDYPVTVVCPIIETKWLSWIDPESGEMGERRRSPKKGRVSDIIPELYYLYDLMQDSKLTVKIIMIEAVEYRLLNGWSRDKKKGSTRHERIPLDITDEITLSSESDLALLVPTELGDEFTSAEYKKAARTSPRKTAYSLKTLSLMGVIERGEKRGNAYIYRRKMSKDGLTQVNECDILST